MILILEKIMKLKLESIIIHLIIVKDAMNHVIIVGAHSLKLQVLIQIAKNAIIKAVTTISLLTKKYVLVTRHIAIGKKY